ncbi:VanZ family protein [Chitinimonas sp. BJYL2]|uniref:VanZ family protein n=1 Tax=Chitinimonas sp. BJYL2 TaxID=2976696 RepID=UPI0022B2DEAC|nr:VanZ family protein [Chitinimonas sp. BJYL2]
MRWQLPISYLARGAAPSLLGRHFLLAWHAVILVTSWYPFSGWRYTGEGVFAFYTYPLPYYFTLADNLLNLLAYVPLGYAWAMAWRCRWYAPLLALLFGGALSVLVEFVQQFLPGRVPSNLDVMFNAAGALAGALLAGLSTRLMLVRLWYVWRQRWLREGAGTDLGLTLLVVWLIAQMNPTVPLFGVVVQPLGIPQPWTSPVANAALFLRVLEAAGVMLSVSGVGLLVAGLVAQRRHAAMAIWLLVLTAVVVKMLFAGALLKPTEFLAWFNLNVLAGAVGAAILMVLLLRLRRHWQSLAALACIALAQWVEAVWPLVSHPSGVANLFRWRYGHLRDFSGLSQTLSEAWPWLAMGYLAWRFYGEWVRTRQPVVIRL